VDAIASVVLTIGGITKKSYYQLQLSPLTRAGGPEGHVEPITVMPWTPRATAWNVSGRDAAADIEAGDGLARQAATGQPCPRHVRTLKIRVGHFPGQEDRRPALFPRPTRGNHLTGNRHGLKIKIRLDRWCAPSVRTFARCMVRTSEACRHLSSRVMSAPGADLASRRKGDRRVVVGHSLYRE
jgi:hypothetical protein